MMSKKNISRCMLVLVGLAMTVAGATLYHESVSAASTSVYEKALKQGIFDCYGTSRFNAMNNPISVGNESWNSRNIVKSGIGTVALPNNYISKSTLSCEELLFGDGRDFGGVLNAHGVSVPANGDNAAARSFLTKMGYEVGDSAADSGIKCMRASFNYSSRDLFPSTETVTSNEICMNVDESGVVTGYASGSVSSDDANTAMASGPKLAVYRQYVALYFVPAILNGGATYEYKEMSSGLIPYEPGVTTWVDFWANIQRAATNFYNYNRSDSEEVTHGFGKDGAISVCITQLWRGMEEPLDCLEWYSMNGVSETASDIISYRFKNNSPTGIAPANEANKNIFGDTTRVLTKEEVASLYLDYMNTYTSFQCGIDASSARVNGFTSGPVKMKQGNSGEVQECYYKEKDDVPTLYGVFGIGNMLFGNAVTIGDVVSMLNDIFSGDVDMSAIQGAGVSGETIDAGEKDMQGCYDAGVEGVSWILCPTIDNTAQTMDGFEDTLFGMLSVDTNIYGNDSKTRGAWEVFRNIANVVLIIVFLVVIFSQLTGFGIDNYGIKKILPRLIVMGVLLNLSYIICQLAVDVSNVLGAGLSQTFKDLASGFSTTTHGSFAYDFVAAVFGIIAAGGAGASVIAGGVSLVLGGIAGPMVVVSLVLSLLVGLAALLFFFLALGARMIIVIVFIAISPIAFVCYVLPNTQTLFKQWWKVFKAALIIYPICGLLYGLSFVIRGVIFSGSEVNFWQGVLAVVTPFLPFFLLPSLLRGAISALGSVGGFLANAGVAVRRGIGSANQTIRMSEAYKSEAQTQKMNMDRWRAGYGVRGRGNTRKEYKDMKWYERLARGGKGGVARGVMQHASNIKTLGMIDLASGEGAEGILSAAERSVLNEQYKNYLTGYEQFSEQQLYDEFQGAGGASWYSPNSKESSQRMRALINTLDARGKQDRIFSLLEKTNVGGDNDVMAELTRVGSKVASAYGKAGKGMSFTEFMSGVGPDGQQRTSGIASYASKKNSDLIEKGKFTDKDAAIIRKYDNPNNRIIDDKTLVAAEATFGASEIVDELDAMYGQRTNWVTMTPSPAQFANFNESTVGVMSKTEAGRRAIDYAYSGLLNNPDLIAKMDPQALAKARAVYEARNGGQSGAQNGGGNDGRPTPAGGQGEGDFGGDGQPIPHDVENYDRYNF